MITKELKISRLLKEYPDSLSVLLKTSPHFGKLQNKLLRKALAGRVTIEQAASIAGVELNYLLAELNKKAGVKYDGNYSQPSEKGVNNKPDYLKSLNEERIVSLDVRPILDSGKDPLQDILSKITELKNGDVLLIINSFEPIPLYSLLGKKGFAHWTEKVNGYFKVFFYREKDNERSGFTPVLSSPSNGIDLNDFENIIDLDVQELQPPEPMMKILENLNGLDNGSLMRVRHHREPHLLYPRLEERGYYAVCTKLGEDSYEILIARKKD